MINPITMRIEQGDPSKKGRVFTASLLCYVTADAIWSGGDAATDEDVRPVLLVYAAGEGQHRPVTMNLRTGRKALLGDHPSWSRSKKKTVQTLRSADYTFSVQRHPEAVVTTAFLPDVFDLDPGMVDPKGLRFVLAPPMSEVDEDAVKAIPTDPKGAKGPTLEDARTIVRLASIFAVFCDRRSRVPLPQDARFHRLLLRKCLDEKLAYLSTSGSSVYTGRYDGSWARSHAVGFVEVGTTDWGYSPGVMMKSSQADFERVAADSVREFYAVG